MRLLVPLLTTMLLLAGITPCKAEVTEYDIEIVIFEDLSERYLNSEQWPRIEHAITTEENATSAIIQQPLEPASTETPDNNDVIKIVSRDTEMLDAYVNSLNTSSRYRVLVHKAWRQVGLDAESAVDVEIDSNKGPLTNHQTTPSPEVNAGTPESSLTGSSLTNQEETLTSSISGTVKITLGRYLHIYTDLIYKQPANFQSPVAVSLVDSRFSEFLIKTHRRMRSKELHYLDHPLVGILVMALPVEHKETDTQ